MLRPLVRRVSFRIRRRKRRTVSGERRRFGLRCAVKLNPRNARVAGRATALFDSLCSSAGPVRVRYANSDVRIGAVSLLGAVESAPTLDLAKARGSDLAPWEGRRASKLQIVRLRPRG